ncbi:MAG: redoxin domain-containing protein [Phycisphaerales bacterium]|nr:redoxin domain-containing protein [Phycisphaerales bacterium]
MKRIFAASTLALALIAGSTAAAGPEHKDHKEMTKAKAALTLADFVKLPELSIGSTAPKLAIAKFVKGESVTDFEEGQIYVVEFWATWCGPCVAAFPHLSELQKEHGEAVRFIGVNIWEGVDDMGERITKVENFVADQGDRMSYTVAIEDGSAMADTWMKPAAQNGIPAAFIVDGTGHIAWVGHPGSIDEPLADVIAGNFDATDAKNDMLMSAGFNKFQQLIMTGEDLDDARQIANLLINNHLSEEPGGLNAIAWMILTSESKNIGEADYKIAHKAIAIACEKTEWKDWSLLDTYALAAFKVGHKEEAIKWQKKALELAPTDNPEIIDELKGRLAEFEG